jgi:NitT/TauT family transport system ATP-binding protein
MQTIGNKGASEVPYVELNQVSFQYYTGDAPDAWVIRHVTLQLEQGECCCLIGRSGCGKSTLLQLAGGLLKPSEGAALLNGSMIQAGESSIGFVFQQPTLLEWGTVLDNVLLPIRIRRKPTLGDRSRAMELLQQMGIDRYADRYPQQLSGGQQSRVALARALITEPLLLLLDEPFAALDAITREELQDELMQLVSMHRVTMVFVTHDIGEAVYFADRVITIQDGEIRHETAIPYLRPRSSALRYEAGFLNAVKAVRHTLEVST